MYIVLLFLLVTSSLYSDECDSIDHAIVSVFAIRNDTGDVVMSQNCDLSMVPSSCMKVATTGAALHLLGADARFETHLEYDGAIDEAKTLHGNVYIRGGGDPCLASERIHGRDACDKQIAVWADAIQKIGIQKIEGSITPDSSKWEKALASPSWLWEDIGNYYGAGASALSFHENQYSIFFKPGKKVGDMAAILRTEPPLSSLILHSEVTTGKEGSGDCACIYGVEFSSSQYIRGTIPLGVDEFAIKGAIADPAAYCAKLLAVELSKRGIKLENKKIGGSLKRTCLHIAYSPMVKDIVYWTNQSSVNLYAEHILKKMGEVVYKEGSLVSGIKAITDFWRLQGVKLSGFHMADGSGLSRKNLVTARQFVDILLKMKQSPFFSIFLESLPKKEGSVRAKSGFMTFNKGCVGYTEDAVFAIIINNCTNQQAMNDKINDLLSEIQKLTKFPLRI